MHLILRQDLGVFGTTLVLTQRRMVHMIEYMKKMAVILAFTGWPTFAINCPPNPSFEKNLGLIHQAHMVGGEDRLSLKPFARSLNQTDAATKKMFAATGVINCGGLKSTIQLSGHNQLVTGAGHAIMMPETCDKNPKPCKVTFPYSASPAKEYKVKPGSWQDGGCDMKNPKGDWAVFELESPVKCVTPYELPEQGHYVDPPKTVLKVAALADNFRPTEGEERREHNYNFEACRIRDRNIFPNIPLHTDCDAGPGTSGAGELIFRNNKYFLTSIHVTESARKVSGSEYETRTHYNISVPVEGSFLQELRSRSDRLNANSPQGHDSCR